MHYQHQIEDDIKGLDFEINLKDSSARNQLIVNL